MSHFMDEDLSANTQGDSTQEGGSDAESGLEGVDGSAGSSSSLRSNLLLLCFVVIVAGGAMFVMRKYGAQSGVELTDVKIDYKFDSGNQRKTDHEAIMQSLQIMDQGIQIPLNDIRRDPFEMLSKTPVEDTGPVDVFDPEAEARLAAKVRQEAIQKAFEALELHSVITGTVPIARVSGQPVRIGDEVGEYFVVKDIRSRSVILEADGEMYILAQ